MKTTRPATKPETETKPALPFGSRRYSHLTRCGHVPPAIVEAVESAAPLAIRSVWWGMVRMLSPMEAQAAEAACRVVDPSEGWDDEVLLDYAAGLQSSESVSAARVRDLVREIRERFDAEAREDDITVAEAARNCARLDGPEEVPS